MFEFRKNYSELLGAAAKLLKKVGNNVAVNLNDQDVKFLKLSLKDKDVNDDIMNIINGNYYGHSESSKFVWDIIRVIRNDPKPVVQCKPNLHIRVTPSFDC